MRLPEEHGAIDRKKAREMMEYAYGHGVNYFDTAYMYHDGESETLVGEVLNQYPRDTWYLATKMPGWMMRYENGRLEVSDYLAGSAKKTPEDIFEHQLEKCGVDYFDFYLLHNLCETAYGVYTDEDLGIVEYLLAQKNAGRIRHLGFSVHGRADTIDRFLNWKDCFEFALVQLNYLDWTLQDAHSKYNVLTNHGIPVFVMEPVRGGRLASLGRDAEAALKKTRPNESTASWAFRFLQALPNVAVVLSGVTTIEQLKDNIKTCSKLDPVTEAEKQMLFEAVGSFVNMVPCTACGYCRADCPQSLDIPKLISMYNEKSFDSAFTLQFTIDAMSEAELPSACVGCKACSRLCPQGIDIPKVMERFENMLENPR